MPGTPRELFELLGLYEPAEGLDALLNRLNIAGITPQHIYRVVHRRPPESVERAFAPADYDPAQHLKAALLSSEFRENLLSGLLLAFPEKHREVFIHIPKCAGTDLILNLAPNRLTIPKVLEDTRWVSEPEFFDALRGIIRAIPYYDAFFIYGHMVLGNYVELVRASAAEKIFTVLRDPFDMMLSQANYALTRLRRDPAGNDPDTREILDALEVPRLPDRPSLREIRELALRALRVPKIVLPNSTCFHLGTEDRPTYDAALRHIVIYDVEVSTTRRYKDWLRERWGIHSRTRHNLSDHWLTLDDIDDETAEVMREQSAEDRKLFNHLSRLIEESGKVSITGSEIALMIGAGSFDEDTADPIADRTPVQTHRREPRRGVATAMGRRAIEALIGVSGNPTPEFTVQFGTGGDLNEYEHAGWALPETGFTWTSAEAVQLTLSKPVREGDYLLRVTGAPFVVRDKLPDQRIIAIVNGIVLGEAAIRETAAIEYELPAAVLGGDEFMTLVFELPDAARPREMTGAEDDRLLAIAFSRIDLIHCDDLAEGAGPGVATTTVASEPRPRRTFVPKEASDAAPIDLSALMMGFESLGENCEFGLVQRRCGAEPLGLFRFASAPLPKLMAGLEARFEGMADPENLMVQLSDAGTEYMVEDQRFGFLYH
ncbi:MAG TPA: hypothetical protein VM782_23955, partial [Stellaceae bacterium]|nr:hypothetical protein [Stellaceae bacterium]